MTTLVAALKSEPIPVATLLGMGAPYNPRRIEPDQLLALRHSLRQFGAVEPVVANRRTGRIVGGHQRVKAAEAEGIETLPVVWVDLDETAERQLNLALNKISGEWDEPALAALLEELGAAALDLTGFDGSEVEELIARMKREARAVDPDEVPEPPKVAVTKPGDLYVLGKHRLLCGDATKAEDVVWGLDGAKPFLTGTDPPYGVDYDGGASNAKKRERLAGDKSTALYEQALCLSPSQVAYLWHAGTRAGDVYGAVTRLGWTVRAQIIWNKTNAHYAAASADYKQRHEPCLYAVRAPSQYIGPTNEPTVWDIPQPSKNELHPTQKPCECMARPIRNHDAPDVYDPFLGSGTTMIAAEQLNRRCFGLEIEPRYCDVIVARWENFTGNKAVLEAPAA